MHIRRESFFLAIQIVDRALDSNIVVVNRNYKLLSLVSLTLALKLEEPNLSLELIYILGVINSGSRPSKPGVRSSTSSKSQPKSKSKSKKKEKPKVASQISQIKVDRLLAILEDEKCWRISRSDFMKL